MQTQPFKRKEEKSLNSGKKHKNINGISEKTKSTKQRETMLSNGAEIQKLIM